MTEKILIEQLKELDSKLFSPLDLSFASFVCRSAGEADNYSLFLAAALASNASVKRKYTCLDLKQLTGNLNNYFNDLNDFGIQADETRKLLQNFFIPENWCEKLRPLKKAVSIPVMGKVDFVPLVLDEALLYIYRDWACEQRLTKMIHERCAATESESKVSTDRQKLAVFAASRQNLTVISGGPGTGKTTIATAISTMFLEQNPDSKITLCAPTGKAQARLQESILTQIPNLCCSDATREQLQELPISTIHRLLGSRPGTTHFRYNHNHKLVLDVLIVDEASMISQRLMKALLEAIPAKAKLIMLGDMQQLASVESGMVLRDFCLSARDNENLSKNVIELKENHRFAPNRGLGLSVTAIHELSENPSAEEIEEIVNVMRNDPSGEIKVQTLPPWVRHEFEKHLNSYLKNITVDFDGKQVPYLNFKSEKSVERAYELFNKFRIICVHRNGLYGSEVINNSIEQLLISQTKHHRQSFYQGKPIIISENNYAMDLFNGDTGIIWPDKDGNLKAFFPSTDVNKQGFRNFDLNLLPTFNSAYAITVHKAQGSGFQEVLIITPSESSPLMTREMIYTALSRAKKRAVLWTKTKILSEALQSVTKRHSNLRNCLIQQYTS